MTYLLGPLHPVSTIGSEMLTVVPQQVVPNFTNFWQRLSYNVSYWTWSKHKKTPKSNGTKTWMSGFETTLPFLRTLLLWLTECATKKLSNYDMHYGNRFLFPKKVFQIMEVWCSRVLSFLHTHVRTYAYKRTCVLSFETNNVSYLHFRSLLLSISTSESRATSKTLSFFTTALLEFLPQLENELLQELLQPLSTPAKCTTSSFPAKQLQAISPNAQHRN